MENHVEDYKLMEMAGQREVDLQKLLLNNLLIRNINKLKEILKKRLLKTLD